MQTQRSDAAEKRGGETVGARTRSERKAVNKKDEREVAEPRGLWLSLEGRTACALTLMSVIIRALIGLDR